MATAEELLNQVAETETGTGTDINPIQYLTVDLNTRRIVIPSTITNIGVESDDEVKRLWFKMPRYYQDIDLSAFIIRINYTNAEGDGDVYEVQDLTIEEDALVFSWLVGRVATAKAGSVNFVVCLLDLDVYTYRIDREFNTTIAALPVLKGLETETFITEDELDMISQAAEKGANKALEEFERALDETIALCDAYIGGEVV